MAGSPTWKSWGWTLPTTLRCSCPGSAHVCSAHPSGCLRCPRTLKARVPGPAVFMHRGGLLAPCWALGMVQPLPAQCLPRLMGLLVIWGALRETRGAHSCVHEMKDSHYTSPGILHNLFCIWNVLPSPPPGRLLLIPKTPSWPSGLSHGALCILVSPASKQLCVCLMSVSSVALQPQGWGWVRAVPVTWHTDALPDICQTVPEAQGAGQPHAQEAGSARSPKLLLISRTPEQAGSVPPPPLPHLALPLQPCREDPHSGLPPRRTSQLGCRGTLGVLD